MIRVDEEFIPIRKAFAKEYRLKEVLNRLNNLEKNLPTINIVGTNGKGSTSFYLSKALLNKYQKVGLFISPAFWYHNERIQVNNEYISDSDLRMYLQKAQPYIEEFNLTFFEIWTLIAIWYFTDQKVDIVVMEAGIGGQHDTTNLMSNQIATLVTAIGFDHIEVLGESIEEILENKLKIAKPNSKLFISNDNLKWTKEINEVLKTLPASVEVIWTKPVVDEINYQQGNKGLVKSFIETLNIHDEKFLKHNPPNGRFTLLKEGPLVLIDGAHNENGIENLVKSFKLKYPKKNPVILAGFSQVKDFQKNLGLLNDAFPNQVYITEFNHLKSWSIENLSSFEKITDWKEFILENIRLGNDIIICGSLYFIPLVHEWFININ